VSVKCLHLNIIGVKLSSLDMRWRYRKPGKSGLFFRNVLPRLHESSLALIKFLPTRRR